MPGWLWTTNPALRTVLSQEKARLGKSSKGREEHPVNELYTFHIPIYLKTGPMYSVWSHAFLEQFLGGRAEGHAPKLNLPQLLTLSEAREAAPWTESPVPS